MKARSAGGLSLARKSLDTAELQARGMAAWKSVMSIFVVHLVALEQCETAFGGILQTAGLKATAANGQGCAQHISFLDRISAAFSASKDNVATITDAAGN